MPPLPGEEVLATVYTDIHYYFTQPTTRPLLHRFDKASYFYIYYNSTRRTSRLEIANNPGTPDQDAFSGYLDRCRIINSYKFPTLITLVVDAIAEAASPTSPRSAAQEWRLASADPRDQGKNMYRLHTLDLYFWSQEDVKQVTGLFKQFLKPSQLDIAELDEPQETPHDDVSHVVQNLENVAITDPAYRNGQTRNSQNQAQPPATQLPPPPPQPHPGVTSPPAVSEPSEKRTSASGAPQDVPAAYAPMAYNPAAPPAPEPIAHREDTPPPEDGTSGTGLSAALHDPAYTPGFPPQLPPYTATPPSGSVPNPYGAHYGSPPMQSPYGSQYLQQPPSRSSVPSSTMSFGPPPTSTTALSQTASHENRHPSIAEQTYAPPPTDSGTPVQTPGTQFYNQLDQPHQPLTHVQPQYPDYLSARPQQPIGGYSQYQYDQAQQQRPASNTYDVHNQVYRPTEEEHRHSGGHKPSASSGSGKQSRFDSGADRVEKGVGRFLKKLEKKIG